VLGVSQIDEAVLTQHAHCGSVSCSTGGTAVQGHDGEWVEYGWQDAGERGKSMSRGCSVRGMGVLNDSISPDEGISHL
jgi:hypothetical protein